MFFSEELLMFLKTIVFGMGIGLIFDCFRIIRKVVPHKDFLVIIQDTVFCFLSSAYIFILVYYLNFGQIRFYILIGIIISNLIYMLLISKYVINTILFFINLIKKIFVKIRQKFKYFLKKDLKN